jgi:acetyl-CoA acetyltransferase
MAGSPMSLLYEKRPSFLGRTAIAGVGYTPMTKNSGVSVLNLATTACRNAIEDCGLEPKDIDGIVTFSMFGDSAPAQAVAAGLGSPELSFAADLSFGGQAPCYCVTLAAMAVETGMAKNVLVYRALNGRSGLRIGSTGFRSPTSQYRYPIGFSAYPQYIAMWARRYMIETNTGYEGLGAVAVKQREYARRNERAIRRTPLTMESYLDSRFVVDPFRTHDCTSEVDGACALLVTSLDRARDLKNTPAVVQGAAWSTPSGSGLDIADFFSWEDWSRNSHSYHADRLWQSAAMGPKEVDFAEIYDCFSAVVLMGLEGLGLVGRGEAADFVAAGETGPEGSLPTNTHGGLLCEGYLHGMNTVAEAALQIQGRAGDRQLAKHDSCAVTSGALMDGSALVLTRDAA